MPVVSISYSAADEEILAYFYTALEESEISMRVLQLTAEVICPVNKSV